MTIKYKTNGSPWGLEGFYEGYKLVFSEMRGAKTIRGNVDIYSMFSKNAQAAWAEACALCKKRKSQKLGLEDIFLALLNSPSVENLFKRLRVNTDATKTLLKNYLKLSPASAEQNTVQKVPFQAFAVAMKLRNHKIGSLMLMAALLTVAPQDNILQAIFANIGLSLEKLEILSVWISDLDYDFPENSNQAKLLYCCRQAEGLEQHFGYFFEFPAIERAVKLSSKQTLKDLEHKKALRLLVNAAGLAKTKDKKIISTELVKQTAA